MPIILKLNKINPRKFFLLDSIGALLSAIMLGLVLASFEAVFGMPPKVLYLLSLIACVFTVYSFFCYLKFPLNWKPFLRAIAIANGLYCCLTIALVIYFYASLTVIGLIYFVIELIIVAILVAIELKVSTKIISNKV